MIEFCGGEAVLRLLDKASRAPRVFRCLVISSPFVDEVGAKWLGRLAAGLDGVGTLKVLTSREALGRLRTTLEQRPGLDLREAPGLHAKVYGALGHRQDDHEAIVTSANLTSAGLHRNVERGVRLTAPTADAARAVERVVAWVLGRAEIAAREAVAPETGPNGSRREEFGGLRERA